MQWSVFIRRVGVGWLSLGGMILAGSLGGAEAQTTPLPPPAISRQPQVPLQRLPLSGSVPDVVPRATVLGHLNPQQTISVTVGLKFTDPAGAQAYADAVSDPNSPLFRQFLTPEQIAQRFGPAQADYQAVVAHLQANGLQILSLAPNRLSIQAQGTTTQIETAFGTRINLYQESQADRLRRAGPQGLPLTFYANATPVQLPASIAGLVEGVAGLESYARAVPKFKRGASRKDTAPYVPSDIRTAYDTVPLYNSSSQTPAGLGMQGQNRTIGIVELERTITSDITLYVNHFNLPAPSNRAGSNVTFVNINGGPSQTAQLSGEANLDVQMVLGMAPLANIKVYQSNGNVNGTTFFNNYLALVTQIVSDNAVDLVTDSWGITATNSSSYNLFHTQHTMMTMQGITYLNASGDYGSDLGQNGLYPETDPDVLAVGGTVLTLTTPGNQISSEVGWVDSGGGYTTSVPFARPSYQAGRSVPTNINARMIPDIALHAAGANPPNTDHGSYQFIFNGQLVTADGTSFASPICTGCLALVEQYLISQNALPADSKGHQRLGRLNDALYAMNGRNDVFHDITVGQSATSNAFPNGFSCGPYWDFVTGWGSLDFNNLAVALQTPLTVTVTPGTAQVPAGTILPMAAKVQGSNVKTITWSVASGPGSVNSNGVYTAPGPDAVTSPQTVTVHATSILDTALPKATTGTKVFGTATLTVVPTALKSLSLSTNSVVGGTSVQGTITLNGPAGSRGVVVTVSAGGSPAVTVSSPVTVAAQTTSQSFTITTHPVLDSTQVTITATYNGGTETATLTVMPRALSSTPTPVGSSPAPPSPHSPPLHR